MCFPLHVEPNHVEAYTVEALKQMKEVHVRAFLLNPFRIGEALLYKIAAKIDGYW